MSEMYECKEHGDVKVWFPKLHGPGGCPICDMKRQLERLADYEEEVTRKEYV